MGCELNNFIGIARKICKDVLFTFHGFVGS